MSDLQRYQWCSTSPMSHGIFKSDVGTYVKYEDARKRIEELEAELKDVKASAEFDEDFIKLQGKQHIELQRKYEALVEGITFAQSHTSETLHLLQWDQLGWDVPEEVIESLGNADSELRALLEDDDE